MKKRYLLLFLTVLLISCSDKVINEGKANLAEPDNQIEEGNDTTDTDDTTLEETGEDTSAEPVVEEEVLEEEDEEQEGEVTETEPEVDIDYPALYRTHQVNELGQIMVIMYHDLADKPGSYATTAELFRADLERLYNEGYRTVSMTDLVTNNISIPLGTTPVVLTFDDADLSNFYFDETGQAAADSVVGILDDFQRQHEDFGKNAIFYIYGINPFRERDQLEDKLNYLIQEGYEIGNHTYDHDKLSTLSAEGIQKAIAKEQLFLYDYVDYEMQHLSLPYGIRPGKDLIEYVFTGTYNEITYQNLSAVNVGWNPVKSPAHQDFDPRSINRVTCGDDQFELNYWLDYFMENGNKRYISDGDPETTVIPESLVENLKEDVLNVITYDKED